MMTLLSKIKIRKRLIRILRKYNLTLFEEIEWVKYKFELRISKKNNIKLIKKKDRE